MTEEYLPKLRKSVKCLDNSVLAIGRYPVCCDGNRGKEKLEKVWLPFSKGGNKMVQRKDKRKKESVAVFIVVWSISPCI